MIVWTNLFLNIEVRYFSIILKKNHKWRSSQSTLQSLHCECCVTPVDTCAHTPNSDPPPQCWGFQPHTLSSLAHQFSTEESLGPRLKSNRCVWVCHFSSPIEDPEEGTSDPAFLWSLGEKVASWPLDMVAFPVWPILTVVQPPLSTGQGLLDPSAGRSGPAWGWPPRFPEGQLLLWSTYWLFHYYNSIVFPL